MTINGLTPASQIKLQPVPTSGNIGVYQGNATLALDSRRTRPLWFDGRFLAARDLERDQNTFLDRQARLGQAAGFGVIHGLMVDTVAPGGGPADAETIIIRAGQGITPGGDLVMISTDLTVRISDLTEEENLDVQFGISAAPAAVARTRTGLYIVALRPVQFTANPITAYPVSIQGTKNARDGDVIEATAVTLAPFPDPPENYDATTRQSAVARQVFVNGDAGQLSDSLLPLAMISIQRGVIEWVDTWMVRRESGPESTSLRFGLPDIATAQAFTLQYDAQLQQVVGPFVAQGVPARFAATDRFQALPPAGRFPLGSIITDNFTQLFFPQQMDVQLSLIPDDELPAVLEESFSLPSIDLTLPASAYADMAVIALVPVPRKTFIAAGLSPVSLSSVLPRMVTVPKPAGLLRFFRLPAPAAAASGPDSAAWKNVIGTLAYGYYVRRRSAPVFVNFNKEATFTVLTSALLSGLAGLKLIAAVVPAEATGTVAFSDGSNALGSALISGGAATLTVPALAAGTHVFTALYDGDDNFALSTSAPLTQVVT